MKKESILTGLIGLFLGLIIGFMFANSVNRSAALPSSTPNAMSGNSNMPPGHPEVTGNNPTQEQMANAPEVQAAIEKAKNEPDNFDAQVKAAEFYYQIERLDGAIEFLQRANQLKPENYELIVDLGNANFDFQKFEEAEKWYSAALTKKADDVNVRTDLGLTFIYRDTPNYDRAIQEFSRSLEIDPNHAQTLQNLTVAYTKKGDTEKAKSTLSRLEKLDPTNSAIAKLKEDISKIVGKS
jgi:tetratricopeptide (TPR) repeat protein